MFFIHFRTWSRRPSLRSSLMVINTSLSDALAKNEEQKVERVMMTGALRTHTFGLPDAPTEDVKNILSDDDEAFTTTQIVI